MTTSDFTKTSISNLPIVEEMYEKYKQTPSSLDPEWRHAFDSLDNNTHVSTMALAAEKQAPADLRIARLIRAYRTFGHLMAKIDPISTHPIKEPWQLNLEMLGFGSEELTAQFPTLGLLPTPMATLQTIIEALRKTYCRTIGIEYMDLDNPEMEAWVQQHIEASQFTPELTTEQKKMILHQLNRSELFESFIHTKYPGQKRFSIEGGETVIPMLEAIIETGSKIGLSQFVIGMAHRGRLNVLSNILNKSYSEIFSEFEESYIPNSFEGSSDVKYHKGFSSEVTTPQGNKVTITLAPNASHLESVNPVVEGQAFARQVILKDDVSKERVIPILIHGDAAIAGQGVVYETMQLFRLPGYATGGTIHIVINNQVGFTASPEQTRSTRYCTDIAKTFGAPIFHVNAENPEDCVYVTNLAVQIRQKFHCDVFIDLNCYRKYGHNEADEPAYTQPLSYQLIRQKRPIRELYRDQMIHEGIVEKHIAEELEKEFTQGLQSALQVMKESLQKPAQVTQHKSVEPKTVETKVSKELLREVAEKVCHVPENFTIHPKLGNLIQERLSMVTEEKKLLDWGMAETLAYGTLLWEGRSVRISGQDSRRGTFSHRHAAWIDQKNEQSYIPLKHLKSDQGRFDVLNSHLSEYGVLGFEFGYSSVIGNGLVIWEAQFGDFANCGQVMIDQYIATAEQKWGMKFGLTLFLPHGYEGQGPEHSSGRIERFLVLAGENNMRIVVPTTSAQFFHLIRKQALDPVKKPLVVFTPKALLRFQPSMSHLDELTKGNFQEIIDDTAPDADTLVLCSGRVYYDIVSEREKRKAEKMAIIRIEQLYPLNLDLLTKVVKKYKNAKKLIWAQEEPSNMGAGVFLRPLLQQLGLELHTVARPRSASPAVGSYAVHKQQHASIMDALFKGNA